MSNVYVEKKLPTIHQPTKIKYKKMYFWIDSETKRDLLESTCLLQYSTQ